MILSGRSTDKKTIEADLIGSHFASNQITDVPNASTVSFEHILHNVVLFVLVDFVQLILVDIGRCNAQIRYWRLNINIFLYVQSFQLNLQHPYKTLLLDIKFRNTEEEVTVKNEGIEVMQTDGNLVSPYPVEYLEDPEQAFTESTLMTSDSGFIETFDESISLPSYVSFVIALTKVDIYPIDSCYFY